LQDYGDGLAAGRGLGRWFDGYNQVRPHEALEMPQQTEKKSR
jgi:hypothetical protein